MGLSSRTGRADGPVQVAGAAAKHGRDGRLHKLLEAAQFGALVAEALAILAELLGHGGVAPAAVGRLVEKTIDSHTSSAVPASSQQPFPDSLII